MPVVNATVAGIFDEIADLLDIQGANPFRIRAYRNAAQTIGALGTDLRTLLERGTELTDLPGIGDDLAAKVKEILDTGKCRMLEKLHKQVPPAVTELLRIPGLGPKRVRTLWQELDLNTVEQLLRAAKDGRIRGLHGFGAKTEAKILASAQTYLSGSKRHKLSVAARYGEQIAGYLRSVAGVVQVEIAGSFRRMRETVGDLDVLVTAPPDSPVMDRFVKYEDVREVVASGPARGTVILKGGMQVDLRVVPEESFGAALMYFTGSKAHNIALRRIAQEKDLKLNEYGLFRDKATVAGRSEESVYEALGLPWIPPELREDHGEIEAARAGTLPKLVTLADLKGDLHMHSSASDGHASIEAMARAAREHGLEYCAVTDHSRRLTVAHGLDSERLRKQVAEIGRLNERMEGITILSGIEVEILEDGTLDLPDSVLATLDVVIAAVHSRFELSRKRQTERVLKALGNPHVRILAHPTGRLIGEREPYDVDMQRIIRKAKAERVALEVNAHPQRLDLLDVHCRMAKEEGVLVAINSDAHGPLEFEGLRFGVGQARRGWLEKKDVLNTRRLPELQAWLRRD